MGKLIHFLVALAKHVVVRGDCVDFETFATRVNTCLWCKQRDGDKCLKCNCFLPLKTQWRSQRCDLGEW